MPLTFLHLGKKKIGLVRQNFLLHPTVMLWAIKLFTTSYFNFYSCAYSIKDCKIIRQTSFMVIGFTVLANQISSTGFIGLVSITSMLSSVYLLIHLSICTWIFCCIFFLFLLLCISHWPIIMFKQLVLSDLSQPTFMTV